MQASKTWLSARGSALRAGITAVACLIAAACGSPARPDGAVVTDSAGVRIVTNASVDVPEWSVTSEPLLTIGSVDGGGPDQFFRIGAVRRLSDGSIAVYDGGSREVRVFAADGTHLRSFGRDGEGPGEFRGGGRIRVIAGDTIVVWDTRLRRVTVFDPMGTVVRTQSPQGVRGNSTFAGYYADGGLLLVSPIIAPEATAFEQRYARVSLFGVSGALTDSLPRQPWTYTGPLGRGIIPGTTGVTIGPRLFGAVTEVDGDRSGYWVGTQKSEEIVRYDLSGERTTIVRWPPRDRRVRPGDADLELEEILANLTGGSPAAIAQLHNAKPVAEVYPSHGALLVDGTGAVWLQGFHRPGQVGPVPWRVFDAAGFLVGTVRPPDDFAVRDVGQDYLLGLSSDDLGVQYVQLYGVSRTPGQ